MHYLLVGVLVIVGGGAAARGALCRYFGPHVTSLAPWVNTIEVYNNGNTADSFEITVWDEAGTPATPQEFEVPAHSSVRLVMTNFAGYEWAPDDIPLQAKEGIFVIDTDNPRLRPKLSFRYGDSASLCEFFLADTLGWEYVLPNTVTAHFTWTGMVVMNPFDVPLTVQAEAYRNGSLVGWQEIADIAPGTKYVRFSDGFWPGVAYADFDQVRIFSCQQAFPPPMSITGNDSQDRHVFFNAAVTATLNPCFGLYAIDSIVGDLMRVAAGTFWQGRGPGDPCDYADEAPFRHTLTRNLAVMATEVTRQMWADLQALQPTLPADPTSTGHGGGMDHPVQMVTWRAAVLFANLLSAAQGLAPCYFKDEAMSIPLTAANYGTGTVFCDWEAEGYRLPTEGEWEYCCRAGSTTPFSVNEPNFSYCTSYCTAGLLPSLEKVAVFCANNSGGTSPARSRLPNPWGLYDVHGNVWEWCWDWAGAYPAGPVTDYRGPGGSGNRSLRGGGWDYPALSCRSSDRGAYNPDSGLNTGGFRLCRVVE